MSIVSLPVDLALMFIRDGCAELSSLGDYIWTVDSATSTPHQADLCTADFG